MKENYRAWDIDIETLVTPQDFIKAAVLAPSSHNSQPWRFQVVNNDTISVLLEPERQLLESDTNDRQATISVGCALANIKVVADYHGYICTIEYGGKEVLATLCFSKKENTHRGESEHLANFISRRTTNRHPHTNQPLDVETIRSIRALASDSLRMDIVTDPLLVGQLGIIAVDAGIDALEDTGFRHELSSYLKPNSTRSSVGMPGVGFGFPTPLAVLAPTLIRFFNMEKLARKQNLSLFKNTAAILILSTKNDTRTDWLSVGCVYEHISLLTARAGMATAPWAATVQIGKHYQEIQKILGITERPQFFARLGFPTKQTPHSPRLLAEQVTIRGT
jgi:hypothetical protein